MADPSRSTAPEARGGGGCEHAVEATAPDVASHRPALRASTSVLEILRLIALGHTNSEIAEQLFLSVRTVESQGVGIASLEASGEDDLKATEAL